MNRKTLLVLLGVIGVQLFLTARVFTPAPHTGGDNAGYIALAHSIVERGAYLELWTPGEPPHTKYPPVFPLLLAGAMAFGVKGWVGLKMVPFASTLLVGVLSFLWVRGRKGDGVAASVALLVVLADAVLYYSRWILSDPTFLALTLGALWTLERGEKKETENPGLWLMAGFALVLLAYFTRSAGLPLVVATVLWLILRRGWGGLAIFSVAFTGSAGLWWWRALQAGGSRYAAEFWLLDPYRPELGRVGPLELLARIWENLLAYVTNFIPEGIIGLEGTLLPILGVGFTLLALVGWGRSVRMGPGLSELFLPLYLGLMLLWPRVWSGDRFALPLFPLLLFYAASALPWVLGGLKPAIRTLLQAGAFLLLAVPSLGSWTQEAEAARRCRALATNGDPWACHGPNVREYVLLAEWSGENLPVGAVVVTRKPRIFFVESSVKTLSLPLTTDADEFLGTTREGGGRYLTVDRWDGLSAYYLPPVLGARPGSFCQVTGVESGGQMGIQLLGIRAEGAERGGGGGGLPRCPSEMVLSRPWPREPVGPGEIPLLVWGHRTR
jgi:hypothetical protein